MSEETLLDRAVHLQCIGGQFGNQKPTEFISLALKMLQLQPDKEIVDLFLTNEDYKYLTALSAFYIRLTGTSKEIFEQLEPLLQDKRKLRRKLITGSYDITFMDEFVDELLTSDRCCDTILPRLTSRFTLEEQGDLEPRFSPLEAELSDELSDGSSQEEKPVKKGLFKESRESRVTRVTSESKDDSLSIQETNKLRASLGLPPLEL